MASLAGQKPHCLGPRTARAKEGLMPWAGRGALGGGGGGHQLVGLLPLAPEEDRCQAGCPRD